MGTHQIVLSESYPLSTSIQGLDGSKKLWKKVASALEKAKGQT